ncbi:MAG: sulfite exporter TauE/SafE family protein [Gammaproteobacteria bacterium]|nr:sulfite exporter TauE/SafE family protein [Gammaproteobacteria bacterium]
MARLNLDRKLYMLESLTITELALALGVLVVAYLVRGITGFGSGLIAIPILALMLPITLVVPMIGLLDYTASLSHGVSHRRSIQWREIIPLLPFTIIGVLSALYIFKTVDGELLKQILGGFILLYAFYSLFGRNPHGGFSRKWSVIGGGFGGLVGTLFGTGGPFYVIYLQLRGLDKTAFRATIATIFMLDGAARIVGYGVSGFYKMDTIILVLVSLPVMAVAMYVGGHIHTNISQESFKRAIGIVLLGSGTALLLN